MDNSLSVILSQPISTRFYLLKVVSNEIYFWEIFSSLKGTSLYFLFEKGILGMKQTSLGLVPRTRPQNSTVSTAVFQTHVPSTFKHVNFTLAPDTVPHIVTVINLA